jgi:large subunit ribosomal protein L35
MPHTCEFYFTPAPKSVSFFVFPIMQKTKKGVAKRFKITGTGKVMRRSPGKRHLLRKKSVKQRRQLGQDKQVSPGFSAVVHRALPHG